MLNRGVDERENHVGATLAEEYIKKKACDSGVCKAGNLKGVRVRLKRKKQVRVR